MIISRWCGGTHSPISELHVYMFFVELELSFISIVKKDEGGGGIYGWSISDRTDPVFSVEEGGNIFFLEVVFFSFLVN